ncbi:nucleotidyltransferase substrate binding protein [bacterium]|nr:nucleotidyltransferase substrate binding protein [bacterium]
MSKKRFYERFENYKLALNNINETYDCIKQAGLNKIYTMALIQAFEMVFELAWKTLKDYLEFEGIKTDTPRETLKTAFLRNVISDGETWIEMMEVRNKTSHTYVEEFAKSVASKIIENYLPLLNELKKVLEGK